MTKALEVEVNARLRAGLKGATPEARFANLGDGQSVDLLGRRLTLGQLAALLTDGNAARARHLHHHLKEGQWFTGSLGPFLKEFVNSRNAFTHAARLPRDAALPLRNRLMGIGAPGVLLQRSRVEPK